MSAARSADIVGQPGPELARWLAPPRLPYRLAGYALGALNALLMRLFFRLRVSGRQRLPAEGAMILAANHLSDLDPPVLAAALDWPGRVSSSSSEPPIAPSCFACLALHVRPLS